MSSLFIPGTEERVCPICMMLHIKTNPCSYDRLVQVIHTQKEQLRSLMDANREAVETAQTFQKLIKDFTPQAERWLAIENEFINLVVALKNSKVHKLSNGSSVGVDIEDINDLLPPEGPELERWLEERHKFKQEDQSKDGNQ